MSATREQWAEGMARLMLLDPRVDRALDLLLGDGMSQERAGEMVLGAYRTGRDPEEFARHLVKLRRAVRP